MFPRSVTAAQADRAVALQEAPAGAVCEQAASLEQAVPVFAAHEAAAVAMHWPGAAVTGAVWSQSGLPEQAAPVAEAHAAMDPDRQTAAAKRIAGAWVQDPPPTEVQVAALPSRVVPAQSSRADHVPTGHWTQGRAPAVASDAASALKLPSAQSTQAVSAVEPAGADLPAAQAAHWV